MTFQGLDDEYGTLDKIRPIGRRVPQAELFALADCGHSPHRQQAERLIHVSRRFLRRYSNSVGSGLP